MSIQQVGTAKQGTRLGGAGRLETGEGTPSARLGGAQIRGKARDQARNLEEREAEERDADEGGPAANSQICGTRSRADEVNKIKEVPRNRRLCAQRIRVE